MIKIDKTTHLLILFTFALVFVTVYLYYVICDVRKLQAEVRKLNEEADARKTATAKDLETLSNAVMQLSKTSCVIPEKKEVTVTTCVVPQVKEIPVHSAHIVEDDLESVLTEDIRNTLNCHSDDDEDDQQEGVVEEEGQVPDQVIDQDKDLLVEILEAEEAEKVVDTLPSLDDVQSMKYEELRDFCKQHNLSTKGIKDVIMKRVCDFLVAEGK